MKQLDVCQYLLWSGLLKLLKDNAGQAVMKINPNRLEKRVSKLQETIRERFKHPLPEPKRQSRAPD